VNFLSLEKRRGIGNGVRRVTRKDPKGRGVTEGQGLRDPPRRPGRLGRRSSRYRCGQVLKAGQGAGRIEGHVVAGRLQISLLSDSSRILRSQPPG
jgi:hypothetical protein